MTEQEQNQSSFDMAAVALVKQGVPSGVPDPDYEGGFSCRYRGPNGIRCAAGWLFEGEVGKDFDEEARCTRPRIAALLRASGHNVSFVSEMQEAHDIPACSSIEEWLPEWEGRMRAIARNHGLSTAALDAALAARSTGE